MGGAKRNCKYHLKYLHSAVDVVRIKKEILVNRNYICCRQSWLHC